MDLPLPLPASTTKHLATLHHALPTREGLLTLRQRNSNEEGTTGTTLWLGGQVLAAYLCTLAPKRVVELGSGIGFLALCLASTGSKVVATDIEPVLSAVLRPNVSSDSNVEARYLDWVSVAAGGELDVTIDGDWPELLVMADTLYAVHLTPALWATIVRICQESYLATTKAPIIYFALERRDSTMLDAALDSGRQAGIDIRRVAHGRIAKTVERAYGWKAAEWEGVEVYKGRWREAAAP